MMPVQIRNEQKKIRVNQTALKKMAQKCLGKMNRPKAEISILLSDDHTIQELNRLHRGINRPTDVLSFGMREQKKKQDPMPPHPEILGDLAISVPAIQRQAVKRHVAVEEELDFIVIHGILHLLGYDHASQKQKLQMEGIHTALFQACRMK
ncbi:rRNA maturation RNase YbeY [bacterium]|nr:rRNA maturation RNase YbeY [bacterium]